MRRASAISAAFGEYDRETLRALIRDIEPRDELTARVTLIAEAAGVHTAAQGTIPPYDPKTTVAVAIPAPVITEVRSDAQVMLLTASRTLIERVIFTLAPIGITGTTMHVLYRPSGTSTPWAQATVQEETPTSVAIVGVTSGESYDFRLQRTRPGYLASPVASVTGHHVVGRSADPAALANLTIAAVGGQALLRWDLPADLDVQFGGWILFRHSPATSGVAWANTTSIGRTVNGDQSHVYLPLKPGTYIARVYDSLGNVSEPASITTKQASVLAFSPVDELVEDPSFLGTHDGTETIGGVLQLQAGDFDTVADTDALIDWDLGGAGIVTAGTYRFSAGMDFGSVTRVRLTSHIAMTAVNPHDLIDERATPIDEWGDIDGSAAAVTDASVWARATDDDPAGTPTWGPWQRIDSAEITARAIGEIECRLTTADQTFNIEISELQARRRGGCLMPDIARLDEHGVLVAVETVSYPDHVTDPQKRTVALPSLHDMGGRLGGYRYDYLAGCFLPVSTEPLEAAERAAPGLVEGLVHLALALEEAGVIRLPETTRRAVDVWLDSVDNPGRGARRR